MTSRRNSSVFALVVLGALLAPALSFAEPSDADKGQARELVGEGLKALRANDFAAAFKAFSSADKLYHAPTTLLGLARANAGLKRLVAAQEAYNKLIREPVAPNAPEAFVNAVEDGRKELAALAPRVPSVVINIVGPKDPQVTIDGESVSSGALGLKRPVDPGKHVINVVAAGFAPARTEVTAVEGTATPVPVTITMTPSAAPVASASAPPPPPASAAPLASATRPPDEPPPPPAEGPSSQKTYAYVAFGVGGVGLVVGAIAGILAIGKKSDLKTACPGGQCPDSAQSTHDSYKTMGLLSTVGFVTAIVGGGAGAALLLTAPKEQTGGWIRPTIGWNSVGMTGAF